MKRTSSTIIQNTKRNSLLKIDKDNIENLKMLTGELDDEDLALLREKYNEKKELSEAANFVKDFVNELKEGMKDNYDEYNFLKLNTHIISPKYKKNNKSDMILKQYIQKVSLGEHIYDNSNNLFTKRSKHSKKSKKSKHSASGSGDEGIYFKRKTVNPNLLKINVHYDDNNTIAKKDSILVRPNKTYKFPFFEDSNNYFEKKKTIKENLYGRKKSTSFLENMFFEKQKSNNSFFEKKGSFISYNDLESKKSYNSPLLKTSFKKKKRPISKLKVGFEGDKNESDTKTEDERSVSKFNNIPISKTFKTSYSLNSIKKGKTYKSHAPLNKKKNSNLEKKKSSDSDSNEKILKQTRITNENLLKLNDLRKELKSTFIGDLKFNENMNKKFVTDDSLNDLKLIVENEDSIIKEIRYRNLQKKSYVYDSLDDEEIIEDLHIHYLRPDSFYVILLDFLVCICSFINLIYIP